MEEKDTRAAAPRPLTDSELNAIDAWESGGWIATAAHRAAAELREARRLLGEAREAGKALDMPRLLALGTRLRLNPLEAVEVIRAFPALVQVAQHVLGNAAAQPTPSSPSLLDPGEQKT